MKFRGFAWTGILGLIVAALPLQAFAFDNEPDGFRGLAWGTPIEAVENQLTLISNNGDEKFYERESDKLEMDGAALKSIIYRFYGGRFFGVAIYAQRGNRFEFLDAFQTHFGPGEQPEPRADKYYWAGEKSEIILDCKAIIDDCYAVIRSAEAASKEKAADAEHATKDF